MLRPVPAFTLMLVAAMGCEESPQPLGDGPRDYRLDRTRVDTRPIFQFPEAGDRSTLDLAAATSDRCLGAESLTFSSGTAQVKGTTTGAQNEFDTGIRCGGTSSFTGPQRYYKAALQKDRHYRVTLTPTFAAVLYLFSECSKQIINVDCGSGGETGGLVGPLASGQTGTLSFAPAASGTYLLAVDSLSTSQAGDFQLGLEEMAAPKNAACAQAQALALTSGQVTIKGTTTGAKDEFYGQVDCGLSVDFDGPQVYYQVPLTAQTWVRFSLTPDFAAALYVAGPQAGCKSQNINIDCGGQTGTVMPLVAKGQTGTTALYAQASGNALIAVDSLDPKAMGDFSLTVETFTPQGNEVCQGATALTFSSGKALAKGTTATSLNDQGALLTCGGSTPLLGPQRYFTCDLTAGKSYRIALQPTFPALLALGMSCATLPADCATSGLHGGLVAVPSGGSGLILYKPSSSGTHVIVVDSPGQAQAGTFDLTVQEDLPPTLGSCSAPKTLSLGQSPVVELGDTAPLANDLSGVSCGLSAGPFDGPQAYYLAALKGGVTYTVEVVPEKTFDPALYALASGTACTGVAVSAACKGLASDTVGAGVKETLTLSPSSDSTLLLVVDSYSPSETGSFTLTLSWK